MTKAQKNPSWGQNLWAVPSAQWFHAEGKEFSWNPNKERIPKWQPVDLSFAERHSNRTGAVLSTTCYITTRVTSSRTFCHISVARVHVLRPAFVSSPTKTKAGRGCQFDWSSCKSCTERITMQVLGLLRVSCLLKKGTKTHIVEKANSQTLAKLALRRDDFKQRSKWTPVLKQREFWNWSRIF